MKKKLFTIAIALCMVFTMMPAGVFQIETAWATSGAPSTIVKVGGVNMVGDDVITYYKFSSSEVGTPGTATDYNAKYDKKTNTLTLNDFTYHGEENGIYSDRDLNIVLQGHNEIEAKGINEGTEKNSYGIWTEGDLSICGGENQDKGQLNIWAHNGNAIFAFEDNSSQYDESITIENAHIIASSDVDVGIVASRNVTIENSYIQSYGKTYAIQGGHFDSPAPARGSITIAKSDVMAEASGGKAMSAYNIKPTISEKYKYRWKTKINENFTESETAQFTNANNPKFVYIVCWHSHCICGKTHSDVGMHKSEEELAFKEWTDSLSLPSIQGNYCLEQDVYISEPWKPANGTVLCLNGHSIFCRVGTKGEPISVISVGSGVDFTLTDCSKDVDGNNIGKVTHYGDSIGPGVNNAGTFYLYGGNIADNDNRSDSFNGGGVMNHNGATFIMYGGGITGNIAENGAGVYNSAQYSETKKTVFTMYGGTISGNQAYFKGGGVLNQGDFIMEGGSIGGIDDSSRNTAKIGGGVYISSQNASTAGTFAMKGGKIVGNTADQNAGGVFVEVKDDGSLKSIFKTSGDVNITGNKANAADDNVYLGMASESGVEETASIEIGGTLTGSQQIGVTTAKTPTGDDDTVTIATGANSGDEKCFKSDKAGYAIAYDSVNATLVLKKISSSGGSSSSGSGSSIQRPTIVTDDGGDAKLSYNGRTLTIAAKDGYEITDVLLNGVSKGAVTELTGLRTGDKVEVKTAKKAEPTDPAADKNAKLIKGVENTTIVLKSKLTKNKNVLLTWTKSKGYKVDYFEFYRSVKKSSGYGKAAFFTTKDGSWSKYLNTKELKAGKTYYYKVRGVRVIDGKKYYTQWSNKAWRTVK